MAEQDLFEARFAAAYRAYVAEASIEVDAAAVAHSIASAHPGRRMLSLWPAPELRALGWVALAALLIVALIAALVVGSQLRPRYELTPTGVEILSPQPNAYPRVAASSFVVDADGLLWAPEGGRVVRIDPADGSVRAWSVSDDAAFAATVIAAAEPGGVWLINGLSLYLFDGDGIRQTIQAPSEIVLAEQAGDGSLWVATVDGSIMVWDGEAWTMPGSWVDSTFSNLFVEQPRQGRWPTVTALAAQSVDDAWVGWTQPTDMGLQGWVAHYDGAGWTKFTEADCAPLGGAIKSISELPNGEAWVATGAGLGRWDGATWTQMTPSDGVREPVSVVADASGLIWVAETNAMNSLDAGGPPEVHVSRFDGQSWASYGTSNGLEPIESYGASLLATPQGVYVATEEVLIAADGDWTTAIPLRNDRIYGMPTLAIAHDDFWLDGTSFWFGAYGGGSLWHYESGTWSEHPDLDVLAFVSQVAIAPDRTVWAVGSFGTAISSDGPWTIVDDQPAEAIAFDSTGLAWIGASGQPGIWEPEGDRCEIWTLRDSMLVRSRQVIEGCPLDAGHLSLAIDANDDVWAGNIGSDGLRQNLGGDLARFDRRDWTVVSELNGVPTSSVTVTGAWGSRGVLAEIGDSYPASDWLAQGGVPEPFDAHLFDGTTWSVVLAASEAGQLSNQLHLAPDGTLWTSSVHGPARYDGQGWTYPYADLFATRTDALRDAYAIAPDGTVFGTLGSDIVRLPTR